MKININRDNIKENLKPNDESTTFGDMLLYFILIAFFPIFIALATFAAIAAGQPILRALLVSSVFYVVIAFLVIFIRNHLAQKSHDLYSPKKIHGTKREDYSVLTTMILNGNVEQAEAEALTTFTSNRDVDLAMTMANTLAKYKYYSKASTWLQKAVTITQGERKLFVLEQLLELNEIHIKDPVRVKMILEKIAKTFPDTPSGKIALEKLKG